MPVWSESLRLSRLIWPRVCYFYDGENNLKPGPPILDFKSGRDTDTDTESLSHTSGTRSANSPHASVSLSVRLSNCVEAQKRGLVPKSN